MVFRNMNTPQFYVSILNVEGHLDFSYFGGFVKDNNGMYVSSGGGIAGSMALHVFGFSKYCQIIF